MKYGSWVLRIVSGVYLAGLWMDATGCPAPARMLPRAAEYFMAIAALFPEAQGQVVDFRAQAWSCDEARWREIDVRPYFPMEPQDKENRFQRFVNGYADSRATMHALERYLVERHNAGDQDDGIPRTERVGAVRLVRLGTPIPPPGSPITPYTRRPLATYPAAEVGIVDGPAEAHVEERCGLASNGEVGP